MKYNPMPSYAIKGGSSLNKSSKLNWKKYLPVIVAVSLVGGFLVWRSFAAVKLYPYQYSVYSCSGFDLTKIQPDDKCIGESAEALTVRMYQAVLGKVPEFKSNLKDKKGKPVVPGYQFWVQELAGDRTKTNDAGNQFVASSKAASAKSNQVYVEDLYKNLYGKKGDAKGINYWKGQLDSKKKYTRGMVAIYFATQQPAITAQKSKVANYISIAPKVAVVQTAQTDQDIRLVQITKQTTESKKQYETISAYVKSAKKNRDIAKSVGGKPNPSRADLTTISGQQKTVTGYRGKTSGAINRTKTSAGKSKEIYARAKAVADYSPDISAAKIKAQYDKVLVYKVSAEGVNRDLDSLVKEISGHYKTAEGKYEAEQKRIAAEAARRASEAAGGGGSSDSSSGGGTTTTVTPPSNVTSKADLVRWCNARPNEVVKTNNGNGFTTYTYNYQYSPQQNRCQKKTTYKVKCNKGYRVSGSGCYKSSTGIGGSLPRLPYPLCAKKTSSRCIQALDRHWGKTKSENYVTKIRHCSRRMYGPVVSDSHCNTNYGRWRF